MKVFIIIYDDHLTGTQTLRIESHVLLLKQSWSDSQTMIQVLLFWEVYVVLWALSCCLSCWTFWCCWFESLCSPFSLFTPLAFFMLSWEGSVAGVVDLNHFSIQSLGWFFWILQLCQNLVDVIEAILFDVRFIWNLAWIQDDLLWCFSHELKTHGKISIWSHATRASVQ